MTQAIRASSAGLGLAAAKECTDSVLIGETAIIEMPTVLEAQELAKELVSLGAIAEVVRTSV